MQSIPKSSGSISTVTDTGTPLGSRSVTSYPDSDGYCALPTSTIITGTNVRTVTCWVKPNATVDGNDFKAYTYMNNNLGIIQQINHVFFRWP